LIVLHLLPTGYNPVRDAVSDNGVGPQQTLNDRAQEFPRVEDRVISRPHRYGYSAMIGEVSQPISPLTGDFANRATSPCLLTQPVRTRRSGWPPRRPRARVAESKADRAVRKQGRRT
jgi:hypothetical protein